MRAAVRAAFWRFTEPLEGYVACMYRDVKNLVTVGLGQLIDPMPYALGLPFRHADGTLATRPQIADEWDTIKHAPHLDTAGWREAARIAKLHLTREDVEKLVLVKVDANEAILRRRWPEWDDWPADAQLALLSWSWAVGPAARYPRMSAALVAGDFASAAEQVGADVGAEGTIALRNKANRTMLLNAAKVIELDLDPEALYWPRALAA